MYLSNETQKGKQMKVLKIIGILLLLIIVLALVASLLLPKSLEVERETTIDAPIEVVWTMVNTLDSQSKWSPWQNIDSNMKSEIIGKDGEVGAKLSWESDHEKVGKGEHELSLVDAELYRIESALRFVEPWESKGSTYIQLEKGEEDQTIVKWGFKMETPIFTNLFMTLFNAKGNIAKDYDKGLESLSNMSEALALQAELEPTFEIRKEERPAMNYLGMKEDVRIDSLQAYFMRSMPPYHQFMKEGIVDTTYPASALYYNWDPENNVTTVTSAMVWIGTDIPENKEVYQVEAGTFLIIDYYGDYSGMEGAHMAMNKYIQENNYNMLGPVIEEYVTDPEKEADPGKWLSRIVYPVSAKGTE